MGLLFNGDLNFIRERYQFQVLRLFQCFAKCINVNVALVCDPQKIFYRCSIVFTRISGFRVYVFEVNGPLPRLLLA